MQPWLDAKGHARLHAVVRDRPGCIVFEVDVKMESQAVYSHGRQSYYWLCVYCYVHVGALTMQDRRQMREGFTELVALQMGVPYKMRGKVR
jgi:hypothetical protein